MVENRLGRKSMARHYTGEELATRVFILVSIGVAAEIVLMIVAANW